MKTLTHQISEAEWVPVASRRFAVHHKRDHPDSVMVEFRCGTEMHRTWLCPEHTGRPLARTDRFWLAHGGKSPCPAKVGDWLERQGELAETVEISIRPDGKYIEICDWRS